MAPSTSVAPSHTSINTSSSRLIRLLDLFIKNLRLLDLDTRADWPNISAATYSTKDGQQNQKTRIKCTEWALYRLFELWNPEETYERLQPFFPPLEPLQSLNLRSALYRSLNDLKKNGILGRDTILRKTMLDECKGEKLMEILVTFSTAVVKRNVVPRNIRSKARRPVSMRLGILPTLDFAQHSLLIPLSIAHRATLTNLLNHKAERKARCLQFEQLLDQKLDQLTRRLRECSTARVPTPTSAEEAAVKRELRENWPGSSRWPHALLHGDDEVSAGDQPLGMPFDQVWQAVAKGVTLQSDPASMGLVQSLERRVGAQNERLGRWQAFHDEILGRRSGSPGSDEPFGSPDHDAKNLFQFDQHRELHLSRETRDGDKTRLLLNAAPKYQNIISDMQKDLKKVSESKTSGASVSNGDIRTPEKRPVSIPVVRAFQSRAPPPPPPSPPDEPVREQPPSSILAGNVALGGIFSPANSKTLTKDTSPTDSPGRASEITPPKEKIMPMAAVSEEDDFSARETPQMQTPGPRLNGSTDESLVNSHHDDDRVDVIISSVINAPETPLKGDLPLSLAERTRQSVFQANANSKSQSKPDLGNDVPVDPRNSSADLPDSDQGTSLLQRTRKSIANAPGNALHVPRSRKSMLTKGSRNSILYPINQFDTPGKSGPEPRRDVTPKEKLFAEDAEYSSIFKSRPRIKLSPVFSPNEDDSPVKEEGFDVEPGHADGDEDSWIRSSPLRGRG